MYKFIGATRQQGVTLNGEKCIPCDASNVDWQEFLQWEAEGNVAEPWKTEDELLADQKVEQEKLIRETYAQDSEAPVPFMVNDEEVFFNGGQDSASYIKGAADLCAALGETEVTITDADNIPRTLTFEQVEQLVVTIGVAFRTAFFNKQAALVALNQE